MLLIATIHTKAQQIKGRVVELLPSGEESPLPGANVVWEGTNIGATSNEQGFYLIDEPESYPSKMAVTFVGYQIYKKEITEWGYYHIILESSVKISQVKVKGKVNTTKTSVLDPINIQTISTGELEKAACCNLSECFETNSTIDVTFTDAVTGAKQIQMLGLDGSYTQITQENMPLIRGLSSSYGLGYVPGTWIESIQIITGSGSVVNGFESFTGQINLEYYKPESSPKLFWNGYVNQEGKLENNLLLSKKNGDWKSNLFTHISYSDNEIDNYGVFHSETNHHDQDHFMDAPKVKQINLLNRWDYRGNKNYHLAFIARGLVENRVAGQVSTISNPYIADIQNKLFEFISKTGFIQPNISGKSVGLQTSFKKHSQTAIFGDNNYISLQESAYLNCIRQTFINNTNNQLKYGFSYYTDRYTESFTGRHINIEFRDSVRLDVIPGVFSEYTLSKESFNLTTGMRSDYYNQTNKITFLPRLNMKYNPTEKTAIRMSAGKAFRVANVFAENVSFLASTRDIILDELDPEIAWNYGFNFSYCFYMNGREGIIHFNAYRTDFQNQIVVDIETPGELKFYNLQGESYANSIQLDCVYEFFEGFDVKASYKINDVHSTFSGIKKTSPLNPRNRALINISYATNFDKLVFDITSNYIGESRVPNHDLKQEYFSEPFFVYNAQITKKFRYFDLYLGGENLLSYTQKNPILDVTNPNSDFFDASLIYAPIHGRMIYTGFRYKIK